MSSRPRLVTLKDLQDEPPSPKWPRCETCAGPAEIVCASPLWQASGFEGRPEQDRAAFCCRKHTQSTEYWYWFWVVGPEERDDDAPTLWDPDFLIHLGEKTWGPAFIAWLLETYDWKAWNQPEARPR